MSSATPASTVTASSSSSSGQNSSIVNSAILVNRNQAKNPMLQLIKNVPFEFQDSIVPDYIVGQSACVLFLMLKYHMMHPNYLRTRFGELQRSFALRVLLVVVDTEDSSKSIADLDCMCFTNDFTLLLAWSLPEAARYIETLKAYEKKAPVSIQERVETEFVPKLASVLTKANYINKTDVVTLLETFGSFRNICSATEQQMVLCPGIGEKKVARLHRALHAPFMQRSAVYTEPTSTAPATSLLDGLSTEAGSIVTSDVPL